MGSGTPTYIEMLSKTDNVRYCILLVVFIILFVTYRLLRFSIGGQQNRADEGCRAMSSEVDQAAPHSSGRESAGGGEGVAG